MHGSLFVTSHDKEINALFQLPGRLLSVAICLHSCSVSDRVYTGSVLDRVYTGSVSDRVYTVVLRHYKLFKA